MEIQTKNSIYELTVQDIFVAVNMQKLIRSIREEIDFKQRDINIFYADKYNSDRLRELTKEGIEIIKKYPLYCNNIIGVFDDRILDYFYFRLNKILLPVVANCINTTELAKIIGKPNNYFKKGDFRNNDSERRFYNFLLNDFTDNIIINYFEFFSILLLGNDYLVANTKKGDNFCGVTNYIYKVNNKDNKFGINDGMDVEFDDLIEYTKSEVARINSDYKNSKIVLLII